MKLLILGGTRFLGRAIVEAAMAKGNEITLFHRGQTNPDLFPEAEHILGDRDGDLDGLAGGRWDAVIDTCGYVPRIVEQSVRFLAPHVGHYTFISSLSVYADPSQTNMAEDAQVSVIEDETVEEITGETYGALKALCENVVEDIMGERGLSVRSGLIVGPHDPTDRFTYWPARLDRGGEVLAPGAPDSPVQFIDVRDIAAWTLQATEQALSGPYNVTGPATRLTMGELVAACQQAASRPSEQTWVSDSFLQAHNVAPYTEMPLWVPAEYAGYGTFNIEKALASGITYRALEATVKDTLAWHATRPTDHEWRAGLSSEREAELLSAWNERDGTDKP